MHTCLIIEYVLKRKSCGECFTHCVYLLSYCYLT